MFFWPGLLVFVTFCYFLLDVLHHFVMMAIATDITLV